MSRAVLIAAAGLLALALHVSGAQTTADPVPLEHPAIRYGFAATSDPVARLKGRLERGEARLRFERGTGYLRSLLHALDVPIESQVAVFSKTSLQMALVDPSNPRAIYFNDEVAVAWMPGGFIEITAQDPAQGIVFYTLPQSPREGAPQLSAETRCLVCHYSTASGGVPGLLLRSIPTAESGATLPWLGNASPDHRTPLAERWGGWYVTGTHGSLPHLGNLRLPDARAQELPRWDAARTLRSLDAQFETAAYLSAHSDIVALLVYEHQVHMTNLLTRVGWEARVAAHEQVAIPAALGGAVNELVDYMLFVDEAPLDGVRGTSRFAEVFSARGPRDRKGRSLRDLDLGTRLLRYPCSYMIYSPAFDGLPSDARDMVYRRLAAVLSGADRAAKYERLSASDRSAVLEILRDTKSNLPDWF